MFTDPRTGMRSIRPARETFAAVALTGMTIGTALRCLEGRTGGVVGVLLTLLGLAVLSRYRISWNEHGIRYQTPFCCRHRRWADLSGYSLQPEERDRSIVPAGPPTYRFAWLEPCRLHLHGRHWDVAINLKPYSWQDIRHLTCRVSHDLPLREHAAVMVS